ncbi:uncharacterized protein [Dermacentor albipictus]|uniref:uncharacterized protein n=1 Tax=Dermacentor albipictus TaxID=60249 RepID=UPI0031FC8334
MPNTRQTHAISPSPKRQTGVGHSPRSQASDFSEDGDAVIERFCQMIDKIPENLETQSPAGGEEEEALSSVSETTAVAVTLPAGLGSRIQRRIRDIEVEILTYCTATVKKVPVEARKFIMSKIFELVEYCSDLRADAATERGAALALQGQLVDARRENSALRAKLHTRPTAALQDDDFTVLGEASHAGPDSSVPAADVGAVGGLLGMPAAGSPGGRSYAAALGAGLARARTGRPVATAPPAVARPTHDHVAFLTPVAQTATPARDVLRLSKTNIDRGAKQIKDISVHHTRYEWSYCSLPRGHRAALAAAVPVSSLARYCTTFGFGPPFLSGGRRYVLCTMPCVLRRTHREKDTATPSSSVFVYFRALVFSFLSFFHFPFAFLLFVSLFTHFLLCYSFIFIFFCSFIIFMGVPMPSRLRLIYSVNHSPVRFFQLAFLQKQGRGIESRPQRPHFDGGEMQKHPCA